MFNRVRRRLVLLNLAVITVILLVAGAVTYLAFQQMLIGNIDRRLAGLSDRPTLQNRLAESLQPADLQGDRQFQFFTDSAGTVIANPAQLKITRLVAPLSPGTTQSLFTVVVDGTPVRLYARTIARPPGELAPGSVIATDGNLVATVVGTVPINDTTLLRVTGQSLVAVQRSLHLLLIVLLAGGAAALVCSLAGAWWLAGTALLPIQAAYRRQQQFVGDAAHELRTPLTVIQTAADLLNQHLAQPLAENKDLLEDVRQETARMARLTADLLTLARSDQAQLDLAVARVDLQYLAHAATRRLSPLAGELGLTLVCRSDAQRVVVDGDPDRLEQVLTILLDNAIQHTPAGGTIDVTVAQCGQAAELRVSDTGAGISAEALPRVYDRFYRTDVARSRSTGGAGLGLAIARGLVHAHGGGLTLQSVLGVGTTATVTLALATSRQPQARPRRR